MRQHCEKQDVAQRADHRQCAEQAGQRLPVEVAEPLPVRRHETRRDGRRQYRDGQHDVASDELHDFHGYEKNPSACRRDFSKPKA